MKNPTALLGLLLCFSSVAFGSSNFSIYSRVTTSLDGEWKIIVDPYENGYYNYRYEPFDQQSPTSQNAFFNDATERSPTDLIEYDFDAAPSIQVPGDWNTQNEKLYYYEGSVWYRTRFDAPRHKTNDRLFVYFGAVNYRSDVYLNGKKLGVHQGGFTPFYFEITDALRNKDNSLVIKVDNKRHADAVPTLNTDWWNYGGITRSVQLAVVPHSFIRDFRLQLSSQNNSTIEGDVWLDGASAGEKVQVDIPELNLRQQLTVDADGHARVKLHSRKLTLWSPENPKRYDIRIRSAHDKLTDTMGFRTISTQGKNVLLTGNRFFCAVYPSMKNILRKAGDGYAMHNNPGNCSAGRAN